MYNFCLKMVSIDLRKTILKMQYQGYKVTLISRILDMPNSTVWKIIRKFQTTKEVTDLPRTGRPRCIRTKKKIKAIKERVRRNPKRSMKKMASEVETPESATSFVVWNFLIMFQTVELGMSRILEMSVTLYPWECIFKIVFRKSIETIF